MILYFQEKKNISVNPHYYRNYLFSCLVSRLVYICEYLCWCFQVKDALDRLDRHRDPLQSPLVSRVTLAGLMVLTAEDIRDEGLPDWMQVCQ